MPTLIERASELTDRIKSLGDSHATQGESQGFATRVQELSEPMIAISVSARRLEMFATKDISVEAPSLDARMLKKTIDDLAAKFDRDPRSILAADVNWRHATRNKLTNLAVRLDAILSEAWRAHVLALRPAVDQGLLRVLSIDPLHKPAANRVAVLLAQLEALADQLPKTEEDFGKPEGLAAEATQAWKDLPQDMPEEVQELFRAINEGMATAAHLTEDAINWLRENGLLETLAISWRPV